MSRPDLNTASRLVIGTRGSMLAVTQTGQVADALRSHYPDLEVVIKRMTTRGDRTQTSDRPMAEVGGKGLFTAELESALRDGSIDCAVHSSKDLPTELAEGTAVLAWPMRADPRDALIVGADALAPGSLASIPLGATVGSSSLRRVGQWKALRPDLDIQPIRGNIETRIRKVRTGRFAATLLAAAGLKRGGLLAEAAQILPVEQMTPAAGQGALAIQGRAGDQRVAALLAVLDHGPTRRAVAAERAVVARLGGGCNMPLGVYAECRGEEKGVTYLFPQAQEKVRDPFFGRAVLAAVAGRPRIEASAEADSPERLADLLVEQLFAQGGRDLLGI